MQQVHIPHDLEKVLDEAWEAASRVPGFLAEDEARFLGMAAALTSPNLTSPHRVVQSWKLAVSRAAPRSCWPKSASTTDWVLS